MKNETEVGKEYRALSYHDRAGYPEEFCDVITRNLNTDFTAQRMLWYLSHYEYLPEGEIVDEMLAILSDRNAIMQKKELEKTNAAWNEFLQHGFEEED